MIAGSVRGTARVPEWFCSVELSTKKRLLQTYSVLYVHSCCCDGARYCSVLYSVQYICTIRRLVSELTEVMDRVDTFFTAQLFSCL